MMLAAFSEWVFNVGDGKVSTLKFHDEEKEPNWIRISDIFTVKANEIIWNVLLHKSIKISKKIIMIPYT